VSNLSERAVLPRVRRMQERSLKAEKRKVSVVQADNNLLEFFSFFTFMYLYIPILFMSCIFSPILLVKGRD